MALVRAERVLQTSTTNGTGSLTLGDPVTGYRSFASVMSNGDTCYYSIVKVSDSGRPLGDWEVGLGTLTNATTFARTTVLQSTNGGNAVNFTDGLKQVFLTLTSTEIVNIIADIASKASATKVDVYSSNDTWTRPDGAKFVDIIVVSGGKGGSSGSLTANSTLTSVDAAGGTAGGPGELNARFRVPAGNLTGTVTVTIGAGGTGSAGRTTTGTGVNGSNGGNSSFGSYVTASGSTGLSGAGSGGNVADAVGSNGIAGHAGYVVGSSASIISLIAAAGVLGVDAATAATVGSGASTNNATATGGNGGNGTTLTGASAGQISSSGAGGGGAGVASAGAATACIGGDGGNGGFPGGGGGGGGAAAAQRSTLPTGSRSGKGGDGGGGAVIVITHF